MTSFAATHDDDQVFIGVSELRMRKILFLFIHCDGLFRTISRLISMPMITLTIYPGFIIHFSIQGEYMKVKSQIAKVHNEDKLFNHISLLEF